MLVLALPMLASSLAVGVVFQLTELHLLSRLGEAPMTSAIMVNQSVRQVLFMLVLGGSFGTQALISRAVGGGDGEAADHVAGQSLLLGAGLALVAALVGLGFADPLFSLAGPDPAFYEYGVPYLRWVFVLSFGFIGTMLVAAILGGAGDTTTPLLVTIVQICTSLGAEWALMFGHFGLPALGVTGAALGVGIGQAVALALAASVLFRGRSRVHLRPRHLVPDPAALRRIAGLAWPPALQMTGALASNIAFLRLAGGFGQETQTALAIGLRLSMVVPAVCFPIASACATAVGQALGSGKPRRAWRAVGVALCIHGSIMWCFALVAFFFSESLVAAFSDDPGVVRIGSEYLRFASGAFAMWAFYFVFLRSLQGAGDVVVPMLISLGSTFGIVIPLAWQLSSRPDLGPTGIWIAFVTGSVITTVSTGLWLGTGRWARRAPHSRPPAESR